MPVAALTPVLVAVFLMVLFAPATAFSQNNPPPAGASLTPPSVQILDLSGQPLPGGGNGETYVQYTADFTATQTSATITFAFRDDPANISFANVAVLDLTAGGSVPLANNDFSQGVVGSTPTNWTYANVSAQAYEGVVAQGSDCYTEPFCWFDGSQQGYDTINQTINTAAGHNYQISFYVLENSFCSTNGAGLTCNFSDTQLPGIAGSNVVVYVAGGTPVGTQTLTLALLDGGTGTVTDNVGTLTASNCYEAAGIVYQNGDVQTSGTCTATYPVGTALTLTAAPNVPSATTPTSTFGAPASGQVLAIPGWGGACSPIKSNPLVCNLTMNSAESVTAAFVVQGQAAAETLTTGTPTTFPFDGGFQDTGGFDFVGQLTQGAPTTGVVNAVSMDPGTCNTIIGTAFPGAYCFVYQLGSTPANPPDSAQMFELTCPALPGGTCGSVQAANFFATLSSDFTFSTTENPGLTTPGAEGSQTLEYGGGNPYIGVVKFDGPDPYHPCYLLTDGVVPSPTNQVISFNFVDGNPKAKPATGGASGTGSCWLITYNMPNEAPTVSITDGPSNNQDIPLNTPLNATFTCNAVNNSNVSVGGQPVGAVGPYLTVNSCTLTDTYTGAGSPAVISATAGSASANGSGAIDTTNPGPHTLVATVMDSAGNTISTSTMTYNVQGSSSTVVSSSPNPSSYGQLVTFTATVTGVGTPTGQVTWTGIPDCVAAAPLNASGVATCTTSNLAASGTPYPVTTSYSGDNSNSISPGTLPGGQLVNPASQSITFTTANPGSLTVGGPTYTPTATGGASGVPVVISLDAFSTGCSLSGGVVTATQSGTCIVDANQAGNVSYNAAPQVQQSFPINKANQTVKFTSTAPASLTVGGATYTPTATGGASGLPVVISLDGSSTGCSLSGGIVTGTTAGGTCIIDANQAGNNSYNAATQVQQSFPVIAPPAWTVTPANYAFPTSSVGQTPSYTFTVTNPAGGATTAISVNVPGSGNEGGSTPGEVDADDFVITSNGCRNVSLAGGQSCNVTVTWIPDSDNLGSHNGSLAYLQVTKSRNTVLAYATMTGTAIDPTVTVAVNGNNNTYSFTSTSKVTQTVATVSNSGPTMLILGNPSISYGNSNFALAAGSCTRGQMLAPNTSCVINVTFTPPSGSGTVNGKVTIPSNAANGTQTVLLSGQR